MKRNTRVKTSVTLPRDVVDGIDAVAGPGGNRSEVVELALREFLTARARRSRDERDSEIIRRQSRRLNEEALDVLQYQVDV